MLTETVSNLRRRLARAIADDHTSTLEAVWTVEAFEGDIRRDAEGAILNQRVWFKRGRNLIVTGGKTLYLQRLGSNTQTAVTVVGVGTDSTAAAVGQTQLNPSVAGSVLLQAADSGYPSVSGTTETWQATFGTGVANFSWNECGLFNGTTNGTSTMFNRLTIGPFSKTSAVSIVLSVAISQS